LTGIYWHIFKCFDQAYIFFNGFWWANISSARKPFIDDLSYGAFGQNGNKWDTLLRWRIVLRVHYIYLLQRLAGTNKLLKGREKR